MENGKKEIVGGQRLSSVTARVCRHYVVLHTRKQKDKIIGKLKQKTVEQDRIRVRWVVRWVAEDLR